jgi:hypothetical protein
LDSVKGWILYLVQYKHLRAQAPGFETCFLVLRDKDSRHSIAISKALLFFNGGIEKILYFTIDIVGVWISDGDN